MQADLSAPSLDDSSQRNGSSSPPARCPRCRYDLRSAVAGWLDQCPLEGRCSECGLAFAWQEVMDPAKLPHAWGVGLAQSVIGAGLAGVFACKAVEWL